MFNYRGIKVNVTLFNLVYLQLPSTGSSVFSPASFEDSNPRFFPMELQQDPEHPTNIEDFREL